MRSAPLLRQDALLGRVAIFLFATTIILIAIVAGLALVVPQVAIGTSSECLFLLQLVESASKTCTQATKDALEANIAMSANWPDGMLPPVWFGWLDTFLVDVYTALFIVAIAWSYQRLTGLWNDKPVLPAEQTGVLKLLLVASILVVVAGAFCDLGENFLAMAQVHDGLKSKAAVGGAKVQVLAALTMAKFVFVSLNLVQTTCWMRAAYKAVARVNSQTR